MEAGTWEKQPLRFTHAIGYRRPAFPGISVHMQEQAVLLTVYDLKILLLGSKKHSDLSPLSGFATGIIRTICKGMLYT